MNNEELRRLDRTIVWHAFSQMADYDGLIIESANGCELTDIDGRTYLDGASSLWCNIHGHRHPYIDRAIEQQLRRVAHVTNLGMSHPVTIGLAQRLVMMTPPSLQHVFFSGDGASAVEVAMKIAFQYWRQCEVPQPQKTLFIALGNAYHGDTLGTVSLGGVSRFQAMFEPLLFPVLRGPCPDMNRLPDSVAPSEACQHYLDAYRALLVEHADRTVAVVVEPLIQAAAGMVMHPPGFLAGMARLCREFGTLLIVDEIAVGFGRTGKMFACEHEQVSPDMLCIGKGLTGGYLPMSATLTSTAIWNAFLSTEQPPKTFFHGHTYGGNPLAAAAAHATLDLFEMENTLQTVIDKAEYLRDLLADLAQYPQVAGIRQVGLMAAIELQTIDSQSSQPTSGKQNATRSLRPTDAVCSWALERGVWLRPLGNVVPIIPPLAVARDQILRIVQAVEYGLQRLNGKH